MRTYVAKPATVQATRKWWVIDAKGKPLGRLASKVASVLRGKHKAAFTTHVDTGDFVIVINAAQVKVTGRKTTDKMYWSHSAFPGNLRQKSFEQLRTQRPEVPIQKAVRGMLPFNVLGRQMIKKLKIYATDKHPHTAQKPEELR
jgi:large subunit ribosomal protein L13